MSRVYAQAPMAEGLPDYITPGKRYAVTGDGPFLFTIRDNDGDTIPCLWVGCEYLNGGCWTRIEGDDA